MEQKAYNLEEILSQNKYIIPIYQRNYAWGKREISQLITDVFEFINTNENIPYKYYYLGSLVYFKRENGDLELIDGQQRHTTITLINLVLNSLCYGQQINSTNLKFDSRKNTQQFIEELYSNFSQLETASIKGVENIKSAINIIQEELQNKNVEGFAKNFYKNVKLFLVEVPQDTDLNHYFEIMNNRGEQLEKHEIVKSLLMGKIKNDDENIKKKEQEKFAVIWDACSDMSDYVWFNFDSYTRKKIFEQSGNIVKKHFNEILILENKENDNEPLLNNILKLADENKYDLKDFPKEETIAKDKYKSVIDFPNFLLQILKLTDEKVSLDDKTLLEQFQKPKIKPECFIYDLLAYRTIFDKYIIKQNVSNNTNGDEGNWGIREPNVEFTDTNNASIEDYDELVKLQTMIYYSNPSHTNNNWVQDILKEEYFKVEKFAEEVFDKIAKPRFYKSNSDLTYPEITVFNLYFIDFLLWKLYKTKNASEDLKSLKDKIDKKSNIFNNFKFKQLTSKEHLLPRSEATEKENDVLNNLGNLCLISTSQNSSANNKHPKYKKNNFNGDDSSLKRLIMFESFKDEIWGCDQIIEHEKEIRSLIDHFKI